MIKLNQKAPDFTMPDQDGNKHKLLDYKGQWVLVYFYPKDDTPGCTTEACTLRDNFPSFKKLKIQVLGISVDTVKSHKKFADKYKLPFTLLADEDKKIVKKYGVWQKKSLFGVKYQGIVRNSYLINPEGKIAKIYEKVKPAKHAKEVLNDIKVLQQ